MRITLDNVTINYKDKYNDEKKCKKAKIKRNFDYIYSFICFILSFIPFFMVVSFAKYIDNTSINNLILSLLIIMSLIIFITSTFKAIKNVIVCKNIFYDSLNSTTILAYELKKLKHLKAKIIQGNNKHLIINNRSIYTFLYMYTNIKIVDKTKKQVFNKDNEIDDNDNIQVTINVYYNKVVIFINDIQ